MDHVLYNNIVQFLISFFVWYFSCYFYCRFSLVVFCLLAKNSCVYEATHAYAIQSYVYDTVEGQLCDV